jgi:HEAT repeat protein
MRQTLLLMFCGALIAPTARAATPDVAAERLKKAERVLDFALATPDLTERGEALTALGVSRRTDALPKLSEALKSEQGEVRFGAARGLAGLRDPKAGAAITKAFREEKGYAVRKELALAAGACVVYELVPDLKKALVDENQEVVISAAFALRDLGDAGGAATLARFGNPEKKGATKDGADRWSRKVLNAAKEGDKALAAKTLAEMGTAADLPLLETLLAAPDMKQRLWAAAAIVRLSPR